MAADEVARCARLSQLVNRKIEFRWYWFPYLFGSSCDRVDVKMAVRLWKGASVSEFELKLTLLARSVKAFRVQVDVTAKLSYGSKSNDWVFLYFGRISSDSRKVSESI